MRDCEMKKIISFGLAAVCALSAAGAKAACTAAADIDASVREAVCTFNLGRAEKSVPVLTRITDKNGDSDYYDEGYTDAGGNYSFTYNVRKGKTGYFNVEMTADGESAQTSFFIGESFTVEGESFKTKTFSPEIIKAEGMLSGGAMMRYNGGYTAKVCFLEYEFDAPAAGWYELTTRNSEFSQPWTTDFSVRVNSGTEYKPAKYADISKAYTDYKPSPSLMKEYRVGYFYLNEGANKMRIYLDKDDPAQNGNYVVFIDCFKFEMQGCRLDGIATNDSCGVYEYGNDVTLNVNFTADSPKNENYTYTLTDYYGNAENGSLTLSEGENTIPVNLGKKACGWYRFKLFKDETEAAFVTLSVVKPHSERYSGETPFAADYAGTYLLEKRDKFERETRAARLAGIGWMRERTSWRLYQHDSADEPYYADINRTADVLHQNGIKMTTILYGLPDWTDETKLFDIYNFQKKLAENTSVDIWEIDNETDGSPARGPADVYAAFYKAAALGNEAAGASAKTSMAAQCMNADASYNRLFMKNDLQSFGSIYNYHIHTALNDGEAPQLAGKNVLQHRAAAEDNGEKPFWITEAGIYVQADENGEMNDAQRAQQARYAVQSTVESLALGTDKHFWFIWPQYLENGKEMGTFDKNLNPNPSYQSYATLTYMLGKAEYKGKMKNENVSGYIFDTGKGTAAVMWAENETVVSLPFDKDAEITDMMGRSSAAAAENGSASITVGNDPIYVALGSEMPEYEAVRYNRRELSDVSFSEGQRIVIRQVFAGQSGTDARMGYTVRAGQTAQIKLEIYNFNDKAVAAKLRGSLYGSSVEFENDTVTLGAMSKTDVNVTLVPKENQLTGTQLNLIFDCTAEDGSTSSPSASYVIFEEDLENAEFTGALPLSQIARGWHTNNSGGTVTAIDTSDGVHFSVSFTNDARWAYPFIFTSGASPENSEGITFTAKADSGSEGAGYYNVYCDLSDGRKFSLGAVTDIPLKSEWVRVNRSWSDFKLQSNPNNVENAEKLDPSKITAISFGGIFYENEAGYTLKHIGFIRPPEDGVGVTVLSAWSGDEITKVQLTENSRSIGEYELIVASYDENGAVSGIGRKKISDRDAFASYDVNIKCKARSASVRLFAWDKKAFHPLSEAITVR